MSLGIVGPISREMAFTYGLIATFSRQGMLNKNVCNCKLCGEKIERAQGASYTVDDICGPNLSHYYLCPACDAWMASQVQRWFEYAKQVNLERMVKEPSPGDEEIERRIQEQVRKRVGKLK